MNISSTSLTSFISPSSAIKNVYTLNTTEEKAQKTDEMSLSKEGQMMGRMLKQDGDREAHQIALKESIKALGIDQMKTDTMTDEEISEVLTQFESLMGEHMQGKKQASEMNSSELKETLNQLKSIDSQMSGVNHAGGRPKTGGKPPVGGQKPEQVQNTETSESDLIENILELLEELDETEETDETTYDFFYRDMNVIMNAMKL